MKYSLVALLFFIIPLQNEARDYYFHPTKGMDQNDGLSKNQPFKSLSVIASLRLKAGDRIILANGQTYEGSIHLAGQHGTNNQHIVISSENWDQHQMPNAIVDFKNLEAGIYIRDCSHITINNVHLTGNGYSKKDENQSMRCGIIITVSEVGNTSNIIISDLKIKEVYYENPGFQRGASEVKTANGTQKYGWGIRLINLHTRSVIQKVYIANCDISELAHTGIKLTGSDKNIHDIEITNNIVSNVGGPGIQMSEVADVWVHDNTVSHSGSTTDTRKWGRGSGLWTWGASRVLIEKNKFLYANGPGDSAGAHIDFNCDNVIIQYNFSAYNAGGFCEILGNNY
ncbi:MAG: right-handed parallel beta-helix repeat-containing protein, partial [Saprospiraceae bacterium]|nr:right-handed parallel beta-helix repeat-containing protein [Saprospiraceae bacterium]